MPFCRSFPDYDDTIMAAAGQQAEQALADVMREYKGNYIVAVEGNAPLNEDGCFAYWLASRSGEVKTRQRGC